MAATWCLDDFLARTGATASKFLGDLSFIENPLVAFIPLVLFRDKCSFFELYWACWFVSLLPNSWPDFFFTSSARFLDVLWGTFNLLALPFFFFLFLDLLKSSPEESPESEETSESSIPPSPTFFIFYLLAFFFSSFLRMLLWTPIIKDSSSSNSSPLSVGEGGFSTLYYGSGL
jgi:hypothetical protein